MVIASPPVTVEALKQMGLDDARLELHAGELVRMSPTAPQHGRLLLRLGGALEGAVEQAGIGSVMGGDTGFILERNPDTLLGSDIAVRISRPVPIEQEETTFSSRVPDLVVEIVSPSDRAGEVQFKIATFLRAGVKTVVTVWPNMRQVTVATQGGVVRTLTEDEDLDLGGIIPGFVYPIRKLFS